MTIYPGKNYRVVHPRGRGIVKLLRVAEDMIGPVADCYVQMGEFLCRCGPPRRIGDIVCMRPDEVQWGKV